MADARRLTASFRDPSGFVFERGGVLYRQVNQVYREHYDRMMSSGLYRALTEAGQLVTHEEVDEPPCRPEGAYRVLRPERLGFISYPYEWCFSALKDAALLTLAIQKRAVEHGLSLKDASAYNIQFRGGRPVLLDTLSFECYREGEPWPAYRQLCQHFLAPLALMSRVDIRLGQLLRTHLDGVPLDLASRLLPARTWLSFPLLVHLHGHARALVAFAGKAERPRPRPFSRVALLGVIESLESAIGKMSWGPHGTQWADYYQETRYTDAAMEQKRRLVAEAIEAIRPRSVWDLGANTGSFSRLASDRGIPTVALDLDPACVERCYLEVVRRGETALLPLCMDLTNPSPALGWCHRERQSLAERGPADAVLALALVHHLAIGGNVPLGDIAACFAGLGRSLIIEFVPKDDPQVARLLVVREDIFEDYTRDGFERAFGAFYTIQKCEPIADSGRILYLMSR